MERAREAVAHGDANEMEIQIATSGVRVDQSGALIPASEYYASECSIPKVNGNGPHSGRKRWREGEGKSTTPPKNGMDISLHNFGDFQHESQD